MAALIFGAAVFADGGMQLADVSWNSLPTMHWTAAGPSWGG
ncbi:MAG: hypothetical protein R2932_50420 [Caldilineaceae bacterium]